MKFTNLLRNMILEASRFEVLMDKFVKKPLKRGEQLSPKDIEKEKNKIIFRPCRSRLKPSSPRLSVKLPPASRTQARCTRSPKGGLACRRCAPIVVRLVLFWNWSRPFSSRSTFACGSHPKHPLQLPISELRQLGEAKRVCL